MSVHTRCQGEYRRGPRRKEVRCPGIKPCNDVYRKMYKRCIDIYIDQAGSRRMASHGYGMNSKVRADELCCRRILPPLWGRYAIGHERSTRDCCL